jgi:hypothetical protein
MKIVWKGAKQQPWHLENQKDSISEIYTIATKGEMCGSVALGW